MRKEGIKGRTSAAVMLLHHHEHVGIIWPELEERGIVPGTVKEKRELLEHL
jgi:hypothetical protein